MSVSSWCGGRHVGGDAEECHALVAGVDGQAVGIVQDDDRADLEGLRAQAAPGRWVQALLGPAVRGEGLRRRRPLPGSTRERGGAVLCVDEKSQVQALARTSPVLPM